MCYTGIKNKPEEGHYLWLKDSAYSYLNIYMNRYKQLNQEQNTQLLKRGASLREIAVRLKFP